ncbi:MAG: hypothetical protein KF824_03880 [Fimbriimonadaceae bacterium]|nr:MAG: hypothetical protein KF824_03880 [Fimbriimonadaceae bacterium]
MSDKNDVRIAKPCPKDWNEMTGDDQSRFCSHCEKSVHNLAEMSANDAEQLLCNTSGRVCIRMVRGPQGSFKTKQGWFRRVALAGAATLTLIPMTGCEPGYATVTGDAVAPPDQSQPDPGYKSNAALGETVAEPSPRMGDMVPPDVEQGEVAPENTPLMGKAACPPEKEEPEERYITLGISVAVPIEPAPELSESESR